MAASVDLVTTAEVNTYLGLSGSTHDVVIAELIDLVSEFIEDYCNTYFSSTAVTEKLDGGKTYLVTTRAPIISITSITDRADSTVLAATDYDAYYESGLIFLTSDFLLFTPEASTAWAKGRKRFTTVYQAGYTAVPEIIKWVTYQIIGRHIKVIPSSNSKGRWTQPNIVGEDTRIATLLTSEERLLLDRYRNIIV